MVLFRCPRCGSTISKLELPRQIYRFLCRNCDLSYLSEGKGDEVDAFIDLEEAFESGQVSDALQVGDSGRTRPRHEIETLVKSSGQTVGGLPPSVREILDTREDYVVLYRYLRETEAEYGARFENLSLASGLVDALRKRKVARLYRFQEEAIREILAGNDVVIVAPAGSGKTEAFALPIFHRITSEATRFGPLTPSLRLVQAVFVYPTKALSRDQKEKLERLGANEGVTVAVLDGDTPQSEREEICAAPPDVLITDFDTIDYHLRRGDYFCHLLSKVRFLVVDELHQYVGAFGANVHFIIRRIRRLTGDFQVIAASATLPNSTQFAGALFHRQVKTIECAEARRGPIHFLMLFPSGRSFRSAMADIIAACATNDTKVLAFANTHIDAELINLIAKRKGMAVKIHRAGLTAEYRRGIENAFKKGQLQAIVATPTLELGIDIGNLDAVVSMLTDVTRLTQRLGRAGREGQESVAVLVLRDNDPISTYYKNHPEAYFVDLCPAYVEPKNEVVARYQLISAALDKPLGKGEFSEFKEVIRELEGEGVFEEKRGKLYPTRSAWKELEKYNIRGIGDSVTILSSGKTIGERQMPMAAYELHPGALYLHAGSRFRSASFLFKGGAGRAEVERIPEDYSYRTRPLGTSHPEILKVESRGEAYGVQALYAQLQVTEEVYGYLTTELYTDRVVEVKRIPTPITYQYRTRGLAFCAPKSVEAVNEALKLGGENEIEGKTMLSTLTGSSGVSMFDDLQALLEGGSFHAGEHVLIEGSDMLTGGGRGELGGVSMGTSGIIFIFDTSPGGSGISRLLFNRLEEAFKRAHRILEECPCGRVDGCPMCTYSYRCGNNNAPLFKAGAKESLGRILNGEATSVDLDAYKVERPIR